MNPDEWSAYIRSRCHAAGIDVDVYTVSDEEYLNNPWGERGYASLKRGDKFVQLYWSDSYDNAPGAVDAALAELKGE